MTHLIKLDENFNPLPRDAAEWPAVLDTRTQIIWPARYPFPGRRHQWSEGHAAAASLTLCGKTDWHFSTVEEGFTFPDRTRFNPAIDREFFPDYPIDWYWTSTPVASARSVLAWLVGLDDGDSYRYYQDDEGLLLVCRSASASQ